MKILPVSLRLKIGPKLVGLFLVAGVLPMAVVGLLSYNQASGALTKDADGRQAELAFNASDKLDRNLFERYGDVQAFAKSAPAQSMDPAPLNTWMNTMMGTYTPIYNLMIVADTKGRIIAANTVDLDGKPLDSSPLLGQDVHADTWFQKAVSGGLKDGESFVEDLHEDPLMAKTYGAGTKSYAMNFTYPIKDDAGKIVGVWTNRFNWQVAVDVLGAVQKRAHDNGAASAKLYVLNAAGTLLASDASADVLTRKVDAHPVGQRALQQNASGAIKGTGFDGKADVSGFFHSAGYSIYPGIGWSIVATQNQSEALQAASGLARNLIIVAVIAAVLIAIAALLIAGTFSRPIAKVRKALEAVAGGDVSQTVSVDSSDEIGDIARSYCQMTQNLRDTIGSVRGAVDTLAEAKTELSQSADQAAQATQQIAITTGQVAEGTNETARSVQDVSTSMGQLGEAIEQVVAGASAQAHSVGQADGLSRQVAIAAGEMSSTAEHAATGARKAAETAQNGAAMVQKTIDGITRIKRTVDTASAEITRLGDRSNEIGKIVAVINDIAAQTNLLALNAAIEAARAGEQGRGFAVVADEVRQLAERVSTATKEIAELISGVQSGVDASVKAMSEGTSEMESGASVAVEAGTALGHILSAVDEVNGQIEQIASGSSGLLAAANEMTEAIGDIRGVVERNQSVAVEMQSASARVGDAIASIAGVAEENSAATEQVSAGAQEMTAQVELVSASAHALGAIAEDLRTQMAAFTLTEEKQADNIVPLRDRTKRVA